MHAKSKVSQALSLLTDIGTPRLKSVPVKPAMVSIDGLKNRLTDDDVAKLRIELNDAMSAVFNKFGLTTSRMIIRKENSRELSVVLRGSIIDANGFDALHRDLLNYAHQLGFMASIMTASIIDDKDEEYQISGLDMSTKDTKFRLISANTKQPKYMPFSDVKNLLPDYFF